MITQPGTNPANPYEFLVKTRGPLGHILDAGIRCFRAIRVGIKWSSPVKAHFQGQKLFTNIDKIFKH